MTEQNLKKFFNLEKNLYTSGSPIIISDGGLYKDTSGEKIFLGLELKDVKAKEIGSFKVKAQGFDTIWKAIGEAYEFGFEEVQAENLLELDKAGKDLYAVGVVVSEVNFKDGSIWENTEDRWVPLTDSDVIEGKFFDPELVEERKQEYKEKMNKI